MALNGLNCAAVPLRIYSLTCGNLAVIHQILWRQAIQRFVHQNCVIVVMKAVLEKTLDDVKQAEEKERDSYALMRLSQRRQVVEQKLTRVRQQLADSSKVVQFADLSLATFRNRLKTFLFDADT